MVGRTRQSVSGGDGVGRSLPTMRTAGIVLFALSALLLITSFVAFSKNWIRLGLCIVVAAAFIAQWGRNCYRDLNSDHQDNHWWR
jgi:VIT1/CCC1 family predicted Fe2+/Mn2+ transporter